MNHPTPDDPRKSALLKGQSSVEYAVLIGVVVAALVSMGTYMRRGLAGRLRASSDSLGDQYAPGRATSDLTLETLSDTTTHVTLDTDRPLHRDIDGDGKDDLVDVLVTQTTINPGANGKGEQTIQTGQETLDSLSTETVF